MALSVAQIDTAIGKILTSGQSVSIDGVQYTKANLFALWEIRKRLAQDESRSKGRRPVFRAFNLSGAAS